MKTRDLDLLKQLCQIHAPSGSELVVRDFLIEYIHKERKNWKVQPTLIYGSNLQDCLILIFGEPKTAIYAHMDSVGYSVGYGNKLIKIGGPQAPEGSILVGEDRQGPVKGKLKIQEEEGSIQLSLDIDREVDRGTTLVYEMDFKQEGDQIQSCYLDNRLGIWNALKVAETLENGAIVFSAWEEIGGGSVGYLAAFLYHNYFITQALISDITWITDGIQLGKGVAVSMRDSGIPRRSYIDKIIKLAESSGIPFQLEVESAGGSDGNALQRSPYPIDWCFIGAGEKNVHQPNETVHLSDVKAMHELYSYLMKKL